MKIGDRIYVRGYVDEIRKDTVIVRNNGGYFGTIPSEVITGELPSAQPERKKGKWIDETFKPWGLVHHPYKCDQCGEHSEADSDFCPNCGADMRGDDNG